MKSPSPSRHIRYSHSSQLIQRAFNLITAYTGQTKAALREHYARVAQVSPDTIRAWQGGTARPHRANEIKSLARDGVLKAQLGPDWLWPFLWSVDAPCALRDEIFHELRPMLFKNSSANDFVTYALPLTDHKQARAIEVDGSAPQVANADAFFASLGLQGKCPAIVSVGGANGLEERALRRLSFFFEETVVPLCQERQICVFDGGTNAGVMRALGQARDRANATFPLVGVVPTGCVCLPQEDRLDGRAPLEPNHSHFIFLSGTSWKSQARQLSQIATAYSGDAPSLTVLANGGEIAAYDVVHSLFAGRPVVAIEGTGRLADQFAEAMRRCADMACPLGMCVDIQDAVGCNTLIERLLQARR